MTTDLNMRQLRGFVTLCQSGGVTAAARKMGMSQSGLSLLLQSLERSVNAELIDRKSRPLSVSDAGRRFLPIAERILEDVDLAIQSVAADKVSGGRIVVAALPTLAAALLPEAIALFQRGNPEIAVQIRDALTEEIINRVRVGDAHLGLGAFLNMGQDLVSQPLFQDPLMALGLFKSTQQKSITWRTIAKHPLILLTRDSNIRQLAERVGISRRFEIRPKFEVSYISTAVELVRAGFGVTVIPKLEANSFARGSVRSLLLNEPSVTREISVVTRRNFEINEPVSKFIAALKVAQKNKLVAVNQ